MPADAKISAKPAKAPRAPRVKPVLVHREETPAPAVAALAEPVALLEPVAVPDSVVIPEPVAIAPQAANPEVTPMTQSVQGYEELTAFGKANIEALVEANSIFVKGVEEISKEVFSLTRSSLEHAAAATSAILAAKTLQDLVELNADFAKSQYEKLLANSTRIGELTVKLATESSAPITARTHRVVETVVRPAA